MEALGQSFNFVQPNVDCQGLRIAEIIFVLLSLFESLSLIGLRTATTLRPTLYWLQPSRLPLLSLQHGKPQAEFNKFRMWCGLVWCVVVWCGVGW